MSLMDIFIGDNFEERLNNAYEKIKERRAKGESESTFHRCGFKKINGAWKLFEPDTGREIILDDSKDSFTYGEKIN